MRDDAADQKRRRLRRAIPLAFSLTLLAASLLSYSIFVFHVLDRRQPYQELGGDYFTNRLDTTLHIRRLVKELERLGQHVTLEATHHEVA